MKSLTGTSVVIVSLALVAAACGRSAETGTHAAARDRPAGDVVTVTPVTFPDVVNASGTADPYAEATLSTKLMGTVEAVSVREGDQVRAGDVLVRLDARDLDAKKLQAEAAQAQVEAVLREATLHAERMRRLFAEEAAPRAQLDAAETGLARAQAGVNAARAALAELHAVRDYATVRAPFDGIVTARMIEPGSFAAPGMPLIVIQDARRLRLAVTAAPNAVRGLARGTRVEASIEGEVADAVVEGVIPAGGSLYTVNAIVDNSAGRHLAGSAATLALHVGERSAMLVPVHAIVRQGDLTGVHVLEGDQATLRWVRLGHATDDDVEVLAGIRAGERIVVPATLAGGH
jgi:RND family efflux transporter MFP subunit